MTHIEQMIKDLCPNGVEFKPLGEVCEIRTGKGITQSDATEGGEYPIISGGIQPMGYYHLKNRNANTITISRVGANAGFVNFITEDFYLNDKCFTTIPKGENVKLFDIKFLYYYLKNNEETIRGMQSEGGVPTINTQKVGSIEIPLPPLEIQKKIVECLDKFSALAAELQAELQKRRTQYEYYRTRLLTPPHADSTANSTDDCNWEWKTLGEVCLPVKNIKWRDVSPEDEFFYIDLATVNRENRNIENPQTINKGNAPSRAQQIVKAEDILFGTTRPTLQRYCYVPSEYDSQICSTGYCVLRANKNIVLPRWIYYQLSLQQFINHVESNQSGAAYPSISDAAVKAYRIPVPPLAEQERIVALLDKFESLTTSLTEGIPAEQAAQQRRYEYYRDLLLTFDRKAV